MERLTGRQQMEQIVGRKVTDDEVLASIWQFTKENHPRVYKHWCERYPKDLVDRMINKKTF